MQARPSYLDNLSPICSVPEFWGIKSLGSLPRPPPPPRNITQVLSVQKWPLCSNPFYSFLHPHLCFILLPLLASFACSFYPSSCYCIILIFSLLITRHTGLAIFLPWTTPSGPYLDYLYPYNWLSTMKIL